MAVGSAIIAGLGLAYGIYAGERGSDQQSKNLRRQREAQRQAQSQAVSASRQAEMENRRAGEAASFDIGQVLLGEQGKTMPSLFGAQTRKSVDGLTLGRKSLLGRS